MALSLYVEYCRWQCSVWVPTAHRSHFCRSREEKLTVYVAKRPFALFCPRVQDNILYGDILIGSLKVKYSERLTGNTLKDTAQKTQKKLFFKGRASRNCRPLILFPLTIRTGYWIRWHVYIFAHQQYNQYKIKHEETIFSNVFEHKNLRYTY